MSANQKIVFQDEAQFLAWGDGPAGPWVKLLLPDSDDLGPWRGMTAAKKGMAGQRLAVVVVEVTGEEEVKPPAPAEPQKGGALAKLAGRLCADPEFQKWCVKQLDSGAWRVAWPEGKDAFGADEAEGATAFLVRSVCGVASRAEIDHNPKAAVLFHEKIRIPWHDYANGKT